MSERKKALWAAAFTVLFWGASFSAIKVAVSELSPPVLLWVRFGIGTAVLGCLLFLRKSSMKIPSVRDLWQLAGLGFLGVFLHNWIQSEGLKTAGAGFSGLIIATVPVVMALMGVIWLGEKLRRVQLVGILVALAGVVMVTDPSFGSGPVLGRGELLVIISVFTWSLFSVLSRNVLTRNDPVVSMFFSILAGWLCCCVPFFMLNGWSEIKSLSLEGWWAVLFLGIFCSALAYAMWYGALKILPASQVGVFLYLSPVVAMTVAFLWLGEPLKISSMAGGACVLFGVLLVNR